MRRADMYINYETIPNGIKVNYSFNEDSLNNEINNILDNSMKEINDLIITNQNEQYIRILLNRIDKALKILDAPGRIDWEDVNKAIEILRGKDE